MADKKITLDIAINNTDSINSLKDIKDAVKLLKNEALAIGEGGEGFTELTQKAGQLQDKLNDVNDTVRVLAGNSAENLTKSFSSVASAGIGAFGAIQGAQALFGEENKDLQKTLVKLQGLMSLSNGIREFANIGQAAKDFKVVLASLIPALFAETTATEAAAVAQTELNVAMLANPIGLVIAAIVALVAALVIFSDTSEEATNVTDDLSQSENEYRQSIKDTNLEIDRRLKNVKDSIKLLGTEGKEREILGVTIQKENALLDLNIQKQKDLADTLARLAELRILYSQSTDEKKNTQLFNEIQKLRAEGVKIILKQKEEEKLIVKNAGLEILNIEKAYATKANEEAQKRNEQTEKEKDKLIDAERERRRKLTEEAKLSINEIDTAEREASINKRLREEKAYQDKLDEQTKANQLQIDAFNTSEENRKAAAARELEDAKILKDAKIQTVQNGLTTISNLAELFAGKSRKEQEKAFKIQKAAAIGNAIIDTYKSATGAYASLSAIPVVGPALGAIAAAAAITAGLLNVKKIKEQKFDSGGASISGGGGSPSVPNITGGGSATGVNTNSVVPQTPTGVTLFGQNNNTNNLGTPASPIQAYVVESQISDTQARLLAFRTRSEIR